MRQAAGHQTLTLFHAGDLALSFTDTSLAAETCEELFTPHAPHIALALNGIEIISNGSGSHHQLRCEIDVTRCRRFGGFKHRARARRRRNYLQRKRLPPPARVRNTSMEQYRALEPFAG